VAVPVRWIKEYVSISIEGNFLREMNYSLLSLNYIEESKLKRRIFAILRRKSNLEVMKNISMWK